MVYCAFTIANNIASYSWSYAGNIIKINTMGQPMIILSSAQAAFDLLESRGMSSYICIIKRDGKCADLGAIYSDRPKSIMAGEL